jgi:hypothetical protein
MTMWNCTKYAAALTALLFLASGTSFAQQYVYPSKGQSPDQQKKDESECNGWAKQQSGFDPSKPPPPPPASAPTTATGSTPGAGVRGAAGGAIVGGIAGDAGAGAAAGAVMARSSSRRANAQQQQAASSQQAANESAGQASFAKARAVCLEGRGYSVK